MERLTRARRPGEVAITVVGRPERIVTGRQAPDACEGCATPATSATVPLPVPAPSQVLFVKNVNVTVPVGSWAGFASVTVALSCTFVPSATDEPSGITASLALL